MTAKIAAALAAFQAEMPIVAKGKTAKVPTKSGGSYSYTYADLADVTEAAMPVLTKHGLSFSCSPRRTDDGRYELVGVLLHSSGESLEGALPIAGNSPQEIGSALTYMRRYLAGCLTGLVTDDDDDGQLAQQAKKAAAPRKRAEPKAETGEAISDKQVGAIKGAMRERGIEDRDQQLAGIAKVIGREVGSSKELTRAEASKVLDSLKPKQNAEQYAPPPSDADAPPPEGWER